MVDAWGAVGCVVSCVFFVAFGWFVLSDVGNVDECFPSGMVWLMFLCRRCGPTPVRGCSILQLLVTIKSKSFIAMFAWN